MDSGDKSTNKAMSAAYKYAAFMTFAIPTEGDNDADAHTPEVAPQGQRRESTVSPEVPTALISHDDATKVISICAALGGTVQMDLLKAHKVNAITDLPAYKLPKILERLDEKMKAKAEAETNTFAKELADEIQF